MRQIWGQDKEQHLLFYCSCGVCYLQAALLGRRQLKNIAFRVFDHSISNVLRSLISLLVELPVEATKFLEDLVPCLFAIPHSWEVSPNCHCQSWHCEFSRTSNKER
eukprot:15366118-Ditylum_brightwellii.AAC.2